MRKSASMTHGFAHGTLCPISARRYYPHFSAVSPEAFLLIVSRQNNRIKRGGGQTGLALKNLKSASPAEPILNRLLTQKNWKRQSEASFRDRLRMRKRSSYCGTGISSPFPRYPKSCVIVRGKSKAPVPYPQETARLFTGGGLMLNSLTLLRAMNGIYEEDVVMAGNSYFDEKQVKTSRQNASSALRWLPHLSCRSALRRMRPFPL